MKGHLITVAALTGGCALLYYHYCHGRKTNNSPIDINDDNVDLSSFENDIIAHTDTMSDNEQNQVIVSNETLVETINDTNLLISEKHIDKDKNDLSCDISSKQINILSEINKASVDATNEIVKDCFMNLINSNDVVAAEVVSVQESSINITTELPVCNTSDRTPETIIDDSIAACIKSTDVPVLQLRIESEISEIIVPNDNKLTKQSTFSQSILNTSTGTTIEGKEESCSNISTFELDNTLENVILPDDELATYSKGTDNLKLLIESDQSDVPVPVILGPASNQHNLAEKHNISEDILNNVCEIKEKSSINISTTSIDNTSENVIIPDASVTSCAKSIPVEPLIEIDIEKVSLSDQVKQSEENSTGSHSIETSSNVINEDVIENINVPKMTKKSKKQKRRERKLAKDIELKESPLHLSPNNLEKKTIENNDSSEIEKNEGECVHNSTDPSLNNISSDRTLPVPKEENQCEAKLSNYEIESVQTDSVISSENSSSAHTTQKEVPSASQTIETSRPTCTTSTGTTGTDSDLEREITPDHENGNCDSQSLISQGSFDSGQGSIEVETDPSLNNGNVHLLNNQIATPDQFIFYQFEVSQELVGRLIGRKGNFINKIKSLTSTSAIVTDHADNNFKICSIDGKRSNVIQALKLVREHFPIDQYPELTLAQMSTSSSSPQHQLVPVHDKPMVSHLELSAGVVVEVHASHVVSTAEVWLQQPLHPTHAAFSKLNQCLRFHYGNDSTAPVVPLPIPAGTICVCYYNDQWSRCELIRHTQTHCRVILLDIGGIVDNLPVNMLRQIRTDFASLPFQARQTILYNIEPVNGSYTDEGREALKSFLTNVNFATIAAFSLDRVPLINLYQRNCNHYTFINEKLVELGHAKWTQNRRTSTSSSS